MSATSVEDLVNQSLQLAGCRRRIGDIYEGSDPARVALELYGQTRDELLQSGDWPFAMRQVALTAVSPSPGPPPSPWQFEYAYPSDCLRVRYVKPGPTYGGTRDQDPQPVLYSVWNDNRPTTPVRGILTDLATPALVYSAKITDMTTWEPEFTRAFVARYAAKMAPRLAEAGLIQLTVAEAESESMEAGQATDLVAPPAARLNAQAEAAAPRR